MRISANRRRLAWLMLILMPAALQSQPIYRCGNAYSQTPCANGTVVSADDSRTQAQKAQTDAATAQAAHQAGRMERDRLASERRSTASNLLPGRQGKDKRKASPPTPSTTTAAERAGPKTHGKPQKAKGQTTEPGYFTASTRQDEKAKATGTAAKRD